jgi:molybdopterin molybdotransferase
VVDAGILPDAADAVRDALKALAASHDAVLTTGGASRGEEDHLVTSLDAIGRRHLWQLAVKPGRPMSFGQIGDCPVVALPGNPVAAFVCFLLYVRPMLTRMGGGAWPEPQRYLVNADFEIDKRKTGRREFLRGRLLAGENGAPAVRKFERDGSGLITSLREADGLIEIGEDVKSIRRGDSVTFLPFSGLGLPP